MCQPASAVGPALSNQIPPDRATNTQQRASMLGNCLTDDQSVNVRNLMRYGLQRPQPPRHFARGHRRLPSGTPPPCHPKFRQSTSASPVEHGKPLARRDQSAEPGSVPVSTLSSDLVCVSPDDMSIGIGCHPIELPLPIHRDQKPGFAGALVEQDGALRARGVGVLIKLETRRFSRRTGRRRNRQHQRGRVIPFPPQVSLPFCRQPYEPDALAQEPGVVA
jgi:hypothetical protein